MRECCGRNYNAPRRGQVVGNMLRMPCDVVQPSPTLTAMWGLLESLPHDVLWPPVRHKRHRANVGSTGTGISYAVDFCPTATYIL